MDELQQFALRRENFYRPVPVTGDSEARPIRRKSQERTGAGRRGKRVDIMSEKFRAAPLQRIERRHNHLFAVRTPFRDNTEIGRSLGASDLAHELRLKYQFWRSPGDGNAHDGL